MTTAATMNDTLRKQLDALNRHDTAGYVSCYRDDARVFDPAYPDLLDKEAIERDFRDFVTAFPDIRLDVGQMIESGDTIAYEVVMRGTHEGPLVAPTGHIPATNRKIEVRGCGFVRLHSDGRIADERRYYDFAGLLGQLGQLQ